MSENPLIPGYKIEKELGRGGMAVVYLAHEEKLNRKVALKVLELLSAQGKDLAERFMREARTAANLQHSNILSIYDVGQADNRYYMAMEYLRDGTLHDRLRKGPIEPTHAFHVASQIASALDYAHSQGIVHRDIKPDNIMFRSDGAAVVTDFGIAKALESTTKLTKTGMSVGTPHYMSPEQARGQVVDARSDIYSLGIVLFEMLTGRVPFDAEDSVAIAIKHIQEPVPKMNEGDVSHAIHRYQPLIDRLLAKKPEDRIQRGLDLIQLINELQDKQIIPSHSNRCDNLPLRPQRRIEVVYQKTEHAPYVKKSKTSPKKMLLFSGIAFALAISAIFLFFRSKAGVAPGEGGTPLVELKSTGSLLSKDDVKSMASRLGIFLSDWNPSAKGINHRYEAREHSGDQVVVDFATGLMWHQSGSEFKTYDEIKSWMDELNGKKYAGYANWRLPTLEEGASLLQKKKKDAALLFVDPIFSKKQLILWTSDRYSSELSWVVNLGGGTVFWGHNHDISSANIRPVRNMGGSEMKKLLAESEKKSKQEEARLKKASDSSLVSLRSRYTELSDDDIKEMATRLNIYLGNSNPTGTGLANKYELLTVSGNEVVIDHKTGLMWHRSGSPKSLSFDYAQSWLIDLNAKNYAGYSDWRLPTAEEGASLLENSEMNDDLYIDPIFSKQQWTAWTGDANPLTKAWHLVVDFTTANIGVSGRKGNRSAWVIVGIGGPFYVRPVRTNK